MGRNYARYGSEDKAREYIKLVTERFPRANTRARRKKSWSAWRRTRQKINFGLRRSDFASGQGARRKAGPEAPVDDEQRSAGVKAPDRRAASQNRKLFSYGSYRALKRRMRAANSRADSSGELPGLAPSLINTPS